MVGHLRQTSRIAFQQTAELERAHQIRFREEARKREEAKKADGLEDEFFDLAATVVLASDTQIAAFTARLDRYDEATIIAIEQNAKQLEFVRGQIQAMLERAHRLEDGRRVFKSEDNLHVFDEFGAEVSPEIVTPDEIPDHLPRYEAFKVLKDQEAGLGHERQELFDYQDRLDQARDRLGDGDLTKDDLDKLADDLDALMPNAVRSQLTGAPSPTEPALGDTYTKVGSRQLENVSTTVAPSPM